MGRLSKLLLTIGLAVFVSVASADEIDEAKRLIAGGKGAEAYKLLAPLEADKAGDPAYDFLLGKSAIEAGEPGLAIFALERVLAMEPNNAEARAELARAYFLIKDDKMAKKEISYVQKMDVPKSVTATINKFLDALDQRFESQRTIYRAYAEAGIGIDSNVNAATNDDIIAIPAFGGAAFTLSRTALEQDDLFLTGEAGGSITHSITPQLYAFIGGRVHKRINDEENFDTDGFGANFGLRYFRGKNVFTVSMQGDQYHVDRVDYRSTGGFGFQVQRQVDARNQITGFAQHTKVIYPDQEARDVWQGVYGLAWGHALGGKGSPVIFLSGYFASETPDDNGNNTHIGRDYIGLRAGGQYSLRDDLDMLGSLAAQFSEYDGNDPLFLESREDDFFSASFGFNWRPAKGWTIKPRLQWTRNSSNIPTNDYSRTMVFVNARYDIR